VVTLLTGIGVFSWNSIFSQRQQRISQAPQLVVHYRDTVAAIRLEGIHTPARNTSLSSKSNNTSIPPPITRIGPLPVPLQVLEQYKQWHSVQALRRDPHNRTFALGYYSCPLQAGNRLHHFFNSLLWAVVSNRTLLWKYYDKETCHMAQSKEIRDDNEVCGVANTVHDCDPVLERASWLPSYDEFAQELKLPEPLYLNFWTTRTPNVMNRHAWDESYTNFTGIDNRTEWPLVSFPIVTNPLDTLSRPGGRQALLANYWTRETARKLHSLGTNFMFGMFFRESFTMSAIVQKDLIKPKYAAIDMKSTVYFSIALHSRHNSPKKDGADVRSEQRCLDQLLEKAPVNSTCIVYLMSDRPKTIEMLTTWLSTTKNCTSVTALHQEGKSFRGGEHGPWSGLGFYQDLAAVSQARTAFTGKMTTSSSLLVELIEYDRTMEAWRRGENKTEPLLQCKMKRK